ncbi:MAG: ABC transporter permease [Candidatus Dadabacteria bacterium]|nr:MAG: ABC transporter permease [Candidatus Dadabacteria bacterium]
MLLRLGWRNLWRNRRRTLLTMSAIAVAVSFVILLLGLQDGMLRDMIVGATDYYHGHAQIAPEGAFDNPSLYRSLDAEATIEQIARRDGLSAITPRLDGFALLAGNKPGAAAQPAQLLGVDPVRETKVTRLAEQVRRGRWIRSGTVTAEVVIGQGLARRLEADVGDTLAVMGQAADGSIVQELLTVVGIIETGDPGRDQMLAIVPLDWLQTVLVLPGRAHRLVIRVEDPMAADLWVAAHKDDLTGVEVRSWRELLPLLSQMQQMWDVGQYVFTLIFYFAVVLIVANTMTMAFFERFREFAVMRAIGLTTTKLQVLVGLEGALLSLVAGVAGGVFGGLATAFWASHPLDLSAWMEPIRYGGAVIPPQLHTYPTRINTLMPVLLVVVLSIGTTLLPILRLRRLKPAEALAEV